MKTTREFGNVLQIGIGFFCIFFAFDSCAFIAEIVVNDAADYGANVDKHDGYLSLAIIYASFTVANFISAPIVNFVGVKLALCGASVSYALFEAGFLFLDRTYLYASSLLLGVCAAVLWAAQGTYVTQNSDQDSAGRHAGLFYATSQLCLIAGGIFMFFVFTFADSTTTKTTTTIVNTSKQQQISRLTLYLLFGTFVAITVVAIVVFSLLRKPQHYAKSEESEGEAESVEKKRRKTAFRDLNFAAIFRLASTKRMLFVAAAFAYTGITLGFWSTVFPTCVASTSALGYNTKSLLAINAIVQGIGQSTSSFFVSRYSAHFKRSTLTVMATVIEVLSFVGILINFPANSPLRPVDDHAFIRPSIALTLACCFALGLGDACWITQLNAFIISHYATQSAEAFSLYNFYRFLFASLLTYCSRSFQLHVHVCVLTAGAIVALFCFFLADRMPRDDKLATPICGSPATTVDDDALDTVEESTGSLDTVESEKCCKN